VQKYLPGNQHTVIAFKIYMDMSGIVNPANFFSLYFDFNTCITVRKLQKKKSVQDKYTLHKLSN